MAIDVSKLQVDLEEGERCRRTLRVTVPAEEVEKQRKAAVKKLSSRVKIPGFREGKVPPSVVEKRFGPALNEELVDRVVQEAYKGILESRSIRPITEGKVEKVDFQPESELTFQASFDVAPQVELSRVGGFQVKRPAVSVSDDEVEKVLGRLREQEGTWVPVPEGSPADGDKVSVRIERRKDGQEGEEPRGYEFTLGNDEALPDVEAAIRTLEVGGSGEFDVTFPEDVADEEMRGRSDRLRIWLDARKKLELPELDDAFAASVGGFETLEELRSRVRKDLEKEAEREAEAGLRRAIMDQILAANPFELPESMVDGYVRSFLGNPESLSEEDLERAKGELRTGAVHTVKGHLVIDRIARDHELEASEEEVDERVEGIAERSGASPSEVYARLQKSRRLEALEREITEDKVFEFLKEQSEIVESA